MKRFPGRHLLTLIYVASTTLLLVGCDKSGNSPKEQWIDPNKLQLSPIRPELLTDAQMTRVRRLQKAFAEVDPSPVEKWEEDFRRDLHPEREIQIWESIAGPFEAYTTSHSLTLEQKKEIFGLLLVRSTAPRESVVKNFDRKILTEKEMSDVLDLCTNKAKPVEIINQ